MDVPIVPLHKLYAEKMQREAKVTIQLRSQINVCITCMAASRRLISYA